MKGTYLGEFEEVILLTVAVLHGEAYGLSVKYEVERKTSREVNLSAVHAALYRLEEKGFLRTEKGEATKKRGGKRKKLFFLTPRGLKALNEAKELRSSLWSSIPEFVTEGKI